MDTMIEPRKDISVGGVAELMKALRVTAARQAALAMDDAFSPAYRYAMVHGVYPLMAQGESELDADPFYGGYDIPAEAVEFVETRLSNASKTHMTFDELLSACKALDMDVGRRELTLIVRYFYLSDAIPKDVLEELLSDSPTEAKVIRREWDYRRDILDALP
jgi:hypothetical protein